MTKEVKEILSSLKAKQEELGIKSEWIFCDQSGKWITIQGYISSLGRVCRKLNLPLSNNHAFRMAFNSYVLVKKGLEAPERAKLLGHSVETNLRNYTYALSDDHMEDLRAIIDGDSAENAVNQAIEEVSTPQYPTVLKFSKRKESRKPASL